MLGYKNKYKGIQGAEVEEVTGQGAEVEEAAEQGAET